VLATAARVLGSVLPARVVGRRRPSRIIVTGRTISQAKVRVLVLIILQSLRARIAQ